MFGAVFLVLDLDSFILEPKPRILDKQFITILNQSRLELDFLDILNFVIKGDLLKAT